MSSVGALSIALSACSSGFQRFDSSIYEDAIPRQAAAPQNAYPGNVDPTTTASTGSRLSPLAEVAPKQVPQGVYHQPEPTYSAPQSTYFNQPRPQAQPYANYAPAAAPAAPAYQRPSASNWGNGANVSSSSLPEVERTIATQPAPKKIEYTPPKPEVSDDTIYIPPQQTDQVTTASLQDDNPSEQGWTATGGTRINIRQGETLYNLSKRYGVPVDAIRDANGLSSNLGIQTGQQIVIPNYVFGPNAKISAPDNNPETRASNAGVGYVGEVLDDKIAVPAQKPQQFASVANGEAEENYISLPKPPKEHEVIKAAVDGTYVVRSGDSLSAIAQRHGTTVSALQRANGVSGSAIRIGQKLIIPGGLDHTTTASVRASDVNKVDPIVTGGVSTSEPKTATELASNSAEVKAPEATGISQFRWPVRGKIIEKFGDQVAEGTNDGIDISVPEGTAVKAAENGVVIYAGNEISEYGNLVLIRHSKDWVSAYAHARDFEVKKGDKVSRGQIIARSGKTGETDRPKLHFELRKHSRAVNPINHLSGA